MWSFTGVIVGEWVHNLGETSHHFRLNPAQPLGQLNSKRYGSRNNKKNQQLTIQCIYTPDTFTVLQLIEKLLILNMSWGEKVMLDL